MRLLIRTFLWLLFIIAILAALLYVAVNSSYVFNKAAGYFAPQYDIRYDKVSGNVLSGLTLEGLYYKDKKLAREIKIKLNPATLLEGKITVSKLWLRGVNERNLEYMISDLSDESDDNSSGEFPLGVVVKDAKLSMLPFKIGGIRFDVADLNVEYIEYADDRFEFGELRLEGKTSLGQASIKGKYQGRNLHLENLTIQNLDTEEIERLFLGDSGSTGADENRTEDESSIFVPKKMFVKEFRGTILPRVYDGISVSYLSIEGKDLQIDLDDFTAAGDLYLSAVTNLAKADIELLLSQDEADIKTVDIKELDINGIIALIDSNSSSGDTTNSESSDTNSRLKIPFVPDEIKIGKLTLKAMPATIEGIDINSTTLKAKGIALKLSAMNISKGSVELNIDSDIAEIKQKGNITNSVLKSRIEVDLKDTAIDKYDLPIRKGAISKINIDTVIESDKVTAKIKLAASRLLGSKKDEFDLDIDSAMIDAAYSFDGNLKGRLISTMVTPYTKNAKADIDFWMKDEFGYRGVVATDTIEQIDPKIAAMIKGLKIAVEGNLDSLKANIDSRELKGIFVSKDLKIGKLNIGTKDKLKLTKYLKLPKEMEGGWVKVVAGMPIDFNKTLPINADIKLVSNIANIDAEAIYDEMISVDAKAVIPKNSLLKKFDENIRVDALSPMRISAKMKDDDIKADIDSKNLKISAKYNLKSGKTDGNINLGGSRISVSGSSEKNIKLKLLSKSIQSTLNAVSSIYNIDLPDISGDVSLDAEIKELSSVVLNLRSKEIIIGKDRKDGTVLSNISLKLKGDQNGAEIDSYAVETQGVKVYASKPSKIVLKKDKVVIPTLWINDSLKTTGEYDLKSKKGKLKASASDLKIPHDLADIIAALDIKTDINGDRVSVRGKVHLKGGKIKYDMNQKSFAADSDIIILQRQKKKNNAFEKNFAIDLKVDSSKPLVYKMNGINVSMNPDFHIKKRYGSALRIKGRIDLLKGGYYVFEGKKFVLKKSAIYFKGKPTAPILDINIVYRHTGTTIRVKVTGTAAEPSLHFSSDPHMSREEILSFIMFDTGRGGSNNKAEDVTNLVAGTLVKSLFSNMGLKLDHLVLTGSGFEVGKKLSDKITIIYDQEKTSSIKIRIENTKNIETDISFGTNSRSADIFYKKEF